MSILKAVQSENKQWWYVYVTTTTPWGLVTGFATREEAEVFASYPLDFGIETIEIGPRQVVVLQERFQCVEEGCGRWIDPGTSAFLRSLNLIRKTKDYKTERVFGRYLATCLKHIPNRFERDDLV